MDKTFGMVQQFCLSVKTNGKVGLCLDQAWLRKVLFTPVQRGPALNDIQPRLEGVKYLKPIDSSLGYHDLELDEKSSYLTTFSCPFGR